MKYNRIYVPQIDEKDCGIACLAMVLKKYGAVVSLAKLRYLAKTTLEGTSALGIVRAAEQLGLLTHAVKADETLFDTDELHFPFIVHMVKNNSLLHYCIVLKNLPNYIVIADPDPKVGIQRISKEIFFNEWTGIAIFSQSLEILKQFMRSGLISFQLSSSYSDKSGWYYQLH